MKLKSLVLAATMTLASTQSELLAHKAFHAEKADTVWVSDTHYINQQGTLVCTWDPSSEPSRPSTRQIAHRSSSRGVQIRGRAGSRTSQASLESSRSNISTRRTTRSRQNSSRRLLDDQINTSERNYFLKEIHSLLSENTTSSRNKKRAQLLLKAADAIETYMNREKVFIKQVDSLETLYRQTREQYGHMIGDLRQKNISLNKQLNKQPDVVYKERVIRKETQETKKLREENTQLQQENQRLHKQYQRQLTITQNQQEHIQKLPNNTILPQQLYIQLGEDLYSFPNKQLLCEQTKQGISCIHLEDVIEHHKNQ